MSVDYVPGIVLGTTDTQGGQIRCHPFPGWRVEVSFIHPLDKQNMAFPIALLDTEDTIVSKKQTKLISNEVNKCQNKTG